MKKQTAVEWFVDQLSSYTTTDGNIISHHQNITHLFEQAKEMEKEQQIELIKFTKEMCTPDPPIDYIIKEFNKYGKNMKTSSTGEC